jgi:outer membrane protein TolC
MTLNEALAHARAHQPAVRAALARVGAEREAARIPRAQWLPSAGVTAQVFAATANNTTGTYLGAPFVDVPRIGGTPANPAFSGKMMQPYASTYVGAGINQEIFDFGRIAAQAAAADAAVDVARQHAATVGLDVDYAVEEAFFAVYTAKSVLAASEDAYARVKVHRDLAKGGVDAGMRSPVELTRAEADLARFDVGRVRARAGVQLAESVLAAAVGVPDPAIDVPANMPALRDLPSLADAVRDAAARDPRILEAQARVRAQEQATKAIGAELRPNLSLTSSISGRAGGAPPSGTNPVPPGSGLAPDVPNWDVGVLFTWPIWNGPTAARERASRAQEQVEREELGRVRFDRSVAVQQGWIAVQVAQASLPALERGVEAARANYDQADARFKSGLGTSVELADAEALRAQAEIDLALGRFDVARARIELARAIAEEP